MPTLTVTKNWDDGTILTEAHLDGIKTSVETFINTTKLDTDNIQTSGVATGNVADLAITNGKIANTTIESGKLAAATIELLAPAGGMIAYAGASAPTGWLFCYGQAISRDTYATLYAAILTSYGAGDGSTTFNVPDLRGRVPAGKDNMGGSAASRLTSTTMTADGATLGATGGTQTHVLTEAQMPSHLHTQHADTVYNTGASLFQNAGGAPDGDVVAGVNTGSTGGGQAHLNVQPSIITNWIIKT